MEINTTMTLNMKVPKYAWAVHLRFSEAVRYDDDERFGGNSVRPVFK